MRKFLAAFLLATVAGAVTLRDLRNAPAPSEVTYKRVAGTDLKLYVFRPSGTVTRHPGYIWIHGGGWTAGDAQSGFPHAAYAASRGMVGISVEYRRVRPGGPT